MTPAQLDSIETALNLKLPQRYRKTSGDFPFEPVAGDSVYWFFDDPETVIRATRQPLDGSGYNRQNWRPEFVAIGHSPAGDLYVLDTSTESAPVLCLSHETHELEVEWPGFEQFVDDWKQAPQAAEAARAAFQQAHSAFWKRWRVVMGAIVVFLLVFGVLPIVVAQFMKP